MVYWLRYWRRAARRHEVVLLSVPCLVCVDDVGYVMVYWLRYWRLVMYWRLCDGVLRYWRLAARRREVVLLRCPHRRVCRVLLQCLPRTGEPAKNIAFIIFNTRTDPTFCAVIPFLLLSLSSQSPSVGRWPNWKGLEQDGHPPPIMILATIDELTDQL